MLLEDRELTDRAARIEALLDEIESLPDEGMRTRTAEIVQGLLTLYGEGLARVLAIIEGECDGPTGARLLEAFGADELVSHLLLLHDLHPVSVETRVLHALEEVRPYLQSHGGNVELIGVEDGIARLRLQGSCSGCPSSTMTLKLAIEEAIRKACPDLDGIDAEGVAEPTSRPVTFVPPGTPWVPLQPGKNTPRTSGGAWTVVGGLPQLAGSGMLAMEVSATPVLFLKIEGTFYAYRNTCPGCGATLEEAVLQGAELTCEGCGRRYDVRRAGRCLDRPEQHLEPLPLLIQDDIVKVALRG